MTGKARNAIENYIMLPGGEGYSEALKILESLLAESPRPQQKPQQPSQRENTKQEPGKQEQTKRNVSNVHFQPCLFYEGTHEIAKCFKCRDKAYADRLDIVRTKRLCDNCLQPYHIAKRCKAYRACLVCGCKKRHHSLLHQVVSFPASDQVTNEPGVEESTQENTTNHVSQAGASKPNQSKVLLRILPVRVLAVDGSHDVETYAFLDEGSDTKLCETSLLEGRGIKRTKATFSVTNINAEKQQRLGQEVKLKVIRW
ncbi:uncharacterized protein LOC116613574 [Nematostella vectensis]|uniref:uncharacterized protein LOC116613574 n=1 Tax=Nematostella vectensis TaxID=45351 RepID=UPI0020770C1B|nr:uncharacterized protein LOC116613574 [Nematostella vectensis]